ncbi:MAG: glycine/betaine ABC transporter permease [Proteobacteria bacterium]|nr:glycine/betaine ABC transporter permease [Pseudomonadota bacterium]
MKTYALFHNSFFERKPWWILEKLHRVVCQRSNPRSKEYMLTLLKEKFPEAELVTLEQPRSSGKIILLYPDSIGLGWGKIEKRLRTQTQNLTILNSRRRDFELTSSVRRQLLFRRFLEMTFLPELLLMPFILLYGTFIAIQDKFDSGKS